MQYFSHVTTIAPQVLRSSAALRREEHPLLLAVLECDLLAAEVAAFVGVDYDIVCTTFGYDNGEDGERDFDY
jgi:hypothetical protein